MAGLRGHWDSVEGVLLFVATLLADALLLTRATSRTLQLRKCTGGVTRFGQGGPRRGICLRVSGHDCCVNSAVFFGTCILGTSALRQAGMDRILCIRLLGRSNVRVRRGGLGIINNIYRNDFVLGSDCHANCCRVHTCAHCVLGFNGRGVP